MKTKLWKIVLALGILLTLSAVFLCLYNLRESKSAYDASNDIMGKLHEMIPDVQIAVDPEKPESGGSGDDLYAAYEEEEVPEMPSISVDGTLYCGFVTLPKLGIELPVRSDWSYPALKSTPCKFSGNLYSGDFIIAAHNYKSHFGRLNELAQGDEIWFTSADGLRYYYTVEYTEIINGSDGSHMLEGSRKDWELTLYTCDYSGKNRITVRAVRIHKK